jgi:hypothetical protein
MGPVLRSNRHRSPLRTAQPVTANTHNSTLDTFAAGYLRLYQLRHSDEVDINQWRSGDTPVPREDTTERSRGATSDPTYFMFSDERRINLRAAAVEAEKVLLLADRALKQVARKLEAALRSGDPGAPENDHLGN